MKVEDRLVGDGTQDGVVFCRQGRLLAVITTIWTGNHIILFLIIAVNNRSFIDVMQSFIAVFPHGMLYELIVVSNETATKLANSETW